MIRHTARALCAASLVLAPLALSTPAHAVTACTVNGVPASGPVVNGTAGADFIQCASVDPGHVVNGLGGADYIVLTGPVGGTVDAGAGRDSVTARAASVISGTVTGGADADYIQVQGVIAAGGAVRGDTAGDYVIVNASQGTTDGGPGLDFCRVGSGNPPINCEF
ncbi:hypothetical protein ACGFMM_27115 [Streptomyces sp. NPDC048604]|uniref:hypothetical protein n=1 Tax=Streptomyces sp. NPDC048604 TaxID=3365578 RepID=UPI0037121C68